MFTKLMAVLIAAVLVFGGAAATASAAQASLPMDALYPVKTLSESVTLGLSIGSSIKLEKALEHAQRRVEEMAALSAIGVDIPQYVGENYVEQVEYALRLAAKMTDDQMTQALEKIQASLQEQQAAVAQLGNARPDDVQLAGVGWQLQARMMLVQLGLSDAQMFREKLAVLLQGLDGPSSTQDPSVTEEPSVTETPSPDDDNSNSANSNDDNGNSANSNDDNGNSANGNDDDSNGNDDDSNGNDDANGNDDDSNSNDDNGNSANGNDDDSNSNDDANGNDDDSNSNDDDGNSANGNDDDSNSNDDANGNDDDSNSNDDDDRSSSSVSLNSFFAVFARIGALLN